MRSHLYWRRFEVVEGNYNFQPDCMRDYLPEMPWSVPPGVANYMRSDINRAKSFAKVRGRKRKYCFYPRRTIHLADEDTLDQIIFPYVDVLNANCICKKIVCSDIERKR